MGTITRWLKAAKRFSLPSIITVFFLSSCSNGMKETPEHEHQQPQHEAPAADIKLDNGKKWVANKETTEGINNMISYVNGLPAAPAAEDYSALKQKLETEFNQILQRCTMTGEAHNQLHNYLMPMNEYIRQLGSPDVSLSKQSVTALRGYLEKYFQYFQ